MPGEQDFEQAFANLAYAEMEQRAPGLFPYLIGFQLIEKNDDDSRAVGVFGFKVGTQWYYGPIFWLNGKLRGYDLLYIINYDLFIPFEEKWINYITNKKPYELGSMAKGNKQNKSVPDFTPFSQSPITKAGTYVDKIDGLDPEVVRTHMVKSASHDKYEGLDNRLGLGCSLRKFAAAHVASLLTTMVKDADFAEAVYKFYSPSEIMAITADVRNQQLPWHGSSFSKKAAKGVVDVHYLGDGAIASTNLNFLTDKEKEKMMSGDAVVNDTRKVDEKAKVVTYTDGPVTAQEVPLSGLWNFFTGTAFDEGIVIKNPIEIGEWVPNANTPTVLVVQPGERKAALTGRKEFLVGTSMAPEKWKTMYDSLPGVNGLRQGDIAVIIGRDFTATVPFYVGKSMTTPDGVKRLTVDPIHEGKGSYDGWPDYKFSPYDYQENSNAGMAIEASNSGMPSYARNTGHFIEITKDAPRRITPMVTTLLVNPDYYKIVRIGTNTRYRMDTSIRFGSFKQFEQHLRQHGVAKLTLAGTQDEVSVTYSNTKSAAMATGPAMRMLITQVGLGEDDARKLIKMARDDKKVTAMIKQAINFDLPGQAGSFDQSYGAPVQRPDSVTENVGTVDKSLNPQESIESIEPIDQSTQNLAVQAGQQNRKDVFDLSILSSLLKSHSTDELVAEFVKDIILGNDRVGRILFMMYWHFDKFTDRYGDEDMAELEDVLVSTFKGTGDLVLFLVQKSIEPKAIADGSVLDIGGI